MLAELRDKRILILGFGREGQDAFLFLRKLFPKKSIGIADINKVKPQSIKSGSTFVKVHSGKNYLKAIKQYDVVVKSPGIPFKILPQSALSKIITPTDIFFDICPGKIIGVTGTKGKSTTSYFIYQTLKSRGVKVKLLGNIGEPVLMSLLRAKKQDVFVYELSSFQLTNLKKSPRIAVLLNIYKEHLDYYNSFQEYVRAKANIAKYQTKKDCLIYNFRDKRVKRIAQKSKAKKMPIQGKYYELDKAAARAVGEIFKIKPLKAYKLLPHRLEFVGRLKGVDFYNDSLSTIPETTVEALDFLKDRVQTLILGGFDRGLSFKKLGQRISKSKVETVILFPETGKRINQEIKNKRIKRFFAKSMAEAVKLARKYTQKGRTCLMSPASPSFGLFRDYEERGNAFKQALKAKLSP